MTDQVSPSINFRHELFWLIREVPFSPYQHGIGAYELNTAETLGFNASFEVIDDYLFLKTLITTHDDKYVARLHETPNKTNEIPAETNINDPFSLAVNTAKSGPPPILNNLKPQKIDGQQWAYENINMPLNYTGSLLLSSREMTESTYYDESFQAPEGWLLTCNNGQITKLTKIENIDTFFVSQS
ncbi:MAG: hypothetical protein ABJK64_13830 [Paraglaciecola sp.]|uniref:hypothetical protein n=1 Tax=Paraglaciecola sp. TaxID=1920173 RepID=UPI0032993195